MNNLLFIVRVSIFSTLMFVTFGCGGSSSKESNINQAPTASAVYSVVSGGQFTLDASGSSDANGDLLTYIWSLDSKPFGSKASLLNTTIDKPTFTPDVVGMYVFTLTVSDGKTSSITLVSVNATTGNAVPLANAGAAQNVLSGSLVTLDGSVSSDANGDPLTYTWLITSKPNGSSAVLSNSTVIKPTITTDIAGIYKLSLVVNDSKVDSAASIVTVTASDLNSAPIANAGSSRRVATGTLVMLDGSGSSDANGDSLSYNWTFTSKPIGSNAVFSSSTTAKPSFTPNVAGTYELNLVVNDGKINSNSSSVTITASVANIAPVAEAGASQTINSGAYVFLNGAGSSDANGDPLTYQWAFVSRPSGSTAVLSSTTVSAPYFVADTVGNYALSLAVSDGKTSSSDTVNVTAIFNIIPSSSYCCKVCTTGKACGDSCISNSYTCHISGGCAC